MLHDVPLFGNTKGEDDHLASPRITIARVTHKRNCIIESYIWFCTVKLMCTIPFKLEDGAGCFFPLCSSSYCPTGGLSKIDPSVPIVSAMQYGLLKYSTRH